jgi:uncharacterized protein YbjT (DUF2867 family)
LFEAEMKILLFGATGSAGHSVLEACLSASVVDEVRAIVRRPLADSHPKLRTIVHANFLDYSPIENAFRSIDACLFCLGISAAQVSKDDYRKITHDFTLAAAKTLKAQSPMAAFHYISGRGTSSTSRMFWSQVKAQTERELIDLMGADAWRPAFIDAKPSAGIPKIFATFFPLFRLLKPFPSLYIHGHDLGRAILQATIENTRSHIFENPEIRQLAARAKF